MPPRAATGNKSPKPTAGQKAPKAPKAVKRRVSYAEKARTAKRRMKPEYHDHAITPATQVCIPPWASMSIPPMTRAVCDVSPNIRLGSWDEPQSNTALYAKGICEHVFIGQECTDYNPRHRETYFHHMLPNESAVPLDERHMPHLIPVYGHPALAQAWHTHGIHVTTQAVQQATDIPSEVSQIIAGYAEPRMNRYWSLSGSLYYEDDVLIPVPLHPVGAIQSHLGGGGYLLPSESHPTCGSCHSPMKLYLQLRLSDMPLQAALGYALPDIPMEYQLLQCWGCGRCDSKGRADGSRGVLVRIIDMGEATRRVDVVCGEMKGDMTDTHDNMKREPLQCTLIRSWVEREDYFQRGDWWYLLHSYYPGHDQYAYPQKTPSFHILNIENEGEPDTTALGGSPYWDNDNFYSHCSICRRYTQCVFQFAAHELDLEWGEGTSASIQQCPVHRHEFVFSWDCD